MNLVTYLSATNMAFASSEGATSVIVAGYSALVMHCVKRRQLNVRVRYLSFLNRIFLEIDIIYLVYLNKSV